MLAACVLYAHRLKAHKKICMDRHGQGLTTRTYKALSCVHNMSATLTLFGCTYIYVCVCMCACTLIHVECHVVYIYICMSTVSLYHQVNSLCYLLFYSPIRHTHMHMCVCANKAPMVMRTWRGEHGALHDTCHVRPRMQPFCRSSSWCIVIVAFTLTHIFLYRWSI